MADSSAPQSPAIPSAAPPLLARALAIAAIIIAGVCGGLIGYSVTQVQCTDDCPWFATLIGSTAAILTAIGVAVVAVLTLRAMAEWNAQELTKELSRQSTDSPDR